MISRRWTLFLISAALMIIISACGRGQQDHANDETGISPATVFENEYAKVLNVTLQPGESLASHVGEDRLVYTLNDYTIAWSEQESEPETRMWTRGNAHLHQAGLHSATNTGSTVAEWVAFIRKTDELPACEEQSLDSDVNLIENEFTKIVFDNDRFRITEVALPAGEALPMHDGVNRVVYSLSNYSIHYASSVEGSMEKSFSTGDVHWHGGCRHAMENIGDTAARFLVVAYK